MKKRHEWPSLLSEELQDISIGVLKDLFVSPFNDGKAHRTEMTERLTLFLQELKNTGVPCEVWIDGSYTTHKPKPNDIDIVVFISMTGPWWDSPEKVDALRSILDYNTALQRYHCEVFREPQVPNTQQHWKHEFGTTYDDHTPKGIARIIL